MIEKLAGTLPKIGIRPILDGRRRGIRESLEDKTMSMAHQVKELIETSLFYPNGEHVKCVIADTTIGGVLEAANCEDKFSKENVIASISVTPSWAFGSETIDMNPDRLKAIWGFNGTERPGAVYLAASLAAHNQIGMPTFGIYGSDVQDLHDDTIPNDVEEKLLLFSKAAIAVGLMKGKSYLAMGSVSMGILGSDVQANFFQKYLGMRNEYVDMTEFIRRIDHEIYDETEFEKAKNWVKAYCKEGEDFNKPESRRSSEQKEQDWDFVIKMCLIARDLMVGNPKLAEIGFEEEADGHNALISGFQGQRQWTDHFPNGDFMEAILNSTYDWNGLREPYLIATENDSLNAVSMLFGHLLTNTAQLFADVRTYWSPEAVARVCDGYKLEGLAQHGVIHLKNSGSAALDFAGKQYKNGLPVVKPFWEISEDEATSALEDTKWYPALTEYFQGGGFSSQFYTDKEMPVTMCRINIIDGLGPVLQIAEGYTVYLPEEVNEKLDKRTDATWPSTWFVPKITGRGAFSNVYSVMNNWGSNHAAISYGHIGKELITLSSMLRIPVNMHNVDEKEIFRPSVWSSFGTTDLESADYRACANYGPLYK